MSIFDIKNYIAFASNYPCNDTIEESLQNILALLESGKAESPLEVSEELKKDCESANIALNYFEFLNEETKGKINKITQLLKEKNIQRESHADKPILSKIHFIFSQTHPFEKTTSSPSISVKNTDIEDFNSWVQVDENGSSIVTLDIVSEKAPQKKFPPASAPIPIPSIGSRPSVETKDMGFILMRNSASPDHLSMEALRLHDEQERAIKRMGRMLIKDYCTEFLEWIATELRGLQADLHFNKHLDEILQNFYPIDPDKCSPSMRDFNIALAKKMAPNLIQGIRQALLEDPELQRGFAEMILEITTPCCFRDPSSASETNKRTILGLLQGTEEFFSDYNEILASGKITKGASDKEEEDLLFEEFKKKLEGKNKKPIYEPGDPEEVRQNKLLNYLKEIIYLYLSKIKKEDKDQLTPQKQLGVLFLSAFLSKIIDRLFTPLTASLIIHRIHDDDLVFRNPYDNTPPRHLFPADDQAFTKRLGSILHKIGLEIIKFGAAGFFVQAIIKILEPLIHSKMEVWANEVQKGMNKMSSSTCSIMPLLLFYQLLYPPRNTMTPPSPILMGFYNNSVEEREEMQKKFTLDFSQDSYQTFSRLIKKDFNGFTKAAVEHIISLEDFFNNIVRKSYKLLGQEKMLKTIFFYLAEGLKTELER